MLDSKNSAINSVANKLPRLLQLSQKSSLSVLLLLAFMPSVQAANNNNASNVSTAAADTLKAQTTACHNNIEAQTSRAKIQSLRCQNIDCMLTQLGDYRLGQDSYQVEQDNRPPDILSPREQYLAYKAQAWLNYASHEDSISSRSAAGVHALQSGTSILTALQHNNDQSLHITTDIPPTSALMRPDLWATLTALKDSGGITTAPRELAFSEVALIWAATNHCKYGSQQSGGHFRMADRWLEQAREAYINTHDSHLNVKLESLINQYYKQFSPLDPSDDICRGQALPMQLPTLHTEINRTLSVAQTDAISISTANGRIVY
ncbi:cytochrome c553 [Psychrobacter sp. PL19]|uniref:hypothetical protein n=1 Tax=Psychrobacter sp. PL19 TaxID=2760711 RepID=UPI001AEB8C1B